MDAPGERSGFPAKWWVSTLAHKLLLLLSKAAPQSQLFGPEEVRPQMAELAPKSRTLISGSIQEAVTGHSHPTSFGRSVDTLKGSVRPKRTTGVSPAIGTSGLLSWEIRNSLWLAV